LIQVKALMAAARARARFVTAEAFPAIDRQRNPTVPIPRGDAEPAAVPGELT